MPLLPRLRNDSRLCDGTIECRDASIPVHVCVVSDISAFFGSAFMGPFKEGREKRLHLGNSTVRAVHVLLDYAYEVPYRAKLEGNLELTLEVWELANMYGVDALSRDVGRIAAGMKRKANILALLNNAHAYLCDADTVEELVRFAARCFPDFQWAQLHVELLRRVLASSELVATEWTRVCTMQQWVDVNQAEEDEIVRLLEDLRFELLDESQLDEILEDGAAWCPRQVLVKMMRERGALPFCHKSGLLRDEHLWRCDACETVNEFAHKCCSGCARERTRNARDFRLARTTVVARVPHVVDGDFVTRPRKAYCRVGELVVSVCAHISAEKWLGFRVQIERRCVAHDKDMTLNDRVRRFVFSTWVKVVREDFVEDFAVSAESGVDANSGFRVDMNQVDLKALCRGDGDDVGAATAIVTIQLNHKCVRRYCRAKRLVQPLTCAFPPRRS